MVELKKSHIMVKTMDSVNKMDMNQFNEELYHFLHHEVHIHKFKDKDIPYTEVEFILNTLSTINFDSNKCLKFLFDGESCWATGECNNCKDKKCEEYPLEEQLKEFKRIWRTKIWFPKKLRRV
jgi:hypothetical protein